MRLKNPQKAVRIEKTKNVLFVMLFGLFKKTLKPSTTVDAIAIPTDNRSRLDDMLMGPGPRMLRKINKILTSY